VVNITVTDINSLIAFWLVFCRWTAIVFQFPVFDQVGVPGVLKILFCISVSWCFFPFVKPYAIRDILYVGADNFWILSFFYAFVGLMAGFLSRIILQIFNSAGSIITQQVGFGAVRYFDQSIGDQVGPFEKFINITVVTMIVLGGGFYPLFKGSFMTFETMNFVSFSNVNGIVPFALYLFKSVFNTAIILSMPLIVTNIVVMTLLGIIARTVPQMNVLMVSFVLNISLGLFVFILSGEEFYIASINFYSKFIGDWLTFFS
jgi:flagellar biosynthesis protein FliR